MPLVIPTPATVLPTPPTTSDPTTFDARADATLLAQQTMVPQINQLGADTYTNAAFAADQATAAQASATSASAQATAAAASATASAQASNSQKWVSGTTYADGTVVYSPINSQIYRRKGAGAGTTDPSADPVNYEPITGIKPAVVIVSTSTTAQKFTLHVFTATATLTLPTSPAPGDWVSFNNESGAITCVIARNGQNIKGFAQDMTVDNVNYFGTLVYADATRGWIFN
jgi:hypothetical protein